MSLSTVKETGYIPVATNREKTPVKIYYELHGQGDEHVVLVMGLNSSCLAWERQTKYLAETSKYTVLIFDNRGMGLSDAPSGFYSILQMAQDTIDILDHLGWKDSVHLNGVSMGGMICLELAATWPQRFSSLVLTSTSAGRQIPPWKVMAKLSKSAFVSDPKLKIGQAISVIFPEEWLNQKPEQEDLQEYSTNHEMIVSTFMAREDRTKPQTLLGNIGQIAACLKHYVSNERLLKLKESGLPIIVVTGTWDNMVNPKNSYHIAEVLGCHLEIFEGSGHALPNEQERRYNKLLDDHFTAAISLRKQKAIAWKAVTTLSKMLFIEDPKLKIGHAISLIYPPEWLKQKLEDLEYEHCETNQDMTVSTWF